jgi:hypothetical protein
MILDQLPLLEEPMPFFPAFIVGQPRAFLRLSCLLFDCRSGAQRLRPLLASVRKEFITVAGCGLRVKRPLAALVST